MEETATVNWDKLEEAPLAAREIAIAGQVIVMRAPDDVRKIQEVFQSDSKTATRLAMANAETGNIKLKAGDLIEMDLIRLCIPANKPSYKNLAALQRKQAQLYQTLKSTAWTFCGLDSVPQAMDEAEGE